jgi:hypothetical protein
MLLFLRFKNLNQPKMKNLLSSFIFFLAIGCTQKEAAADFVSMQIADTTAVAVDESESKDKVVAINLPPKESSEEKIVPQIIKNATLRFETADLSATYNQVNAALKKYNATINNDSEGKNYNTIFRNLTVRVPSANFDAFIKDISNGVSYFDTKEISSEDVTEEYIDVKSRIKTKKALEDRYLELLKKATKVSEMLEVEQQLSQIREEIESKEGRLKYIQDRVATSTISIEFYKYQAEKSGATVSYGGKIINAIKSGFNGISSFFIGLVGVWPFIVILVAVIYFIRKRFKKKNI